MKLRNVLSDTPLGQILGTMFVDFAQLRRFREMRASILDHPKTAIANRRHNIGIYAVFCATAPYLLSFFLVWAADASNLIPPDGLEKAQREAVRTQHDLIEFEAESRAFCESMRTLSEYRSRRCAEQAARMAEGHRSEIELNLRQIEAFRSVQQSSVTFVIAAIAIWIGAFVFPRIWLRLNPLHATNSDEDIERVRRTYLLIISTTIFIPNCIGATVLLVGNVLNRYDSIFAIILSGWLVTVGLLPFVVGGVLGGYRLNQVLLNRSNWRMGNAWLVLLISNGITALAMAIFAIIFLIIIL